MLWDVNFLTPHKGLHCALAKRMAILQPLYMIHRLGCILSCTKPLDQFQSIKSFRKHISRRGTPFWHSIRSAEDDLWATMHAQLPRSPIQRQLQENERIVIENPMGVQGISSCPEYCTTSVWQHTREANHSFLQPFQ